MITIERYMNLKQIAAEFKSHSTEAAILAAETSLYAHIIVERAVPRPPVGYASKICEKFQEHGYNMDIRLGELFAKRIEMAAELIKTSGASIDA